MTTSPSILKLVKTAIGAIEKQFGQGAIMHLGEDDSRPTRGGISTGRLGVDLALGGEGLPKGRIIEIYGPEGSGKTTLALQAIARAHQEGSLCAFIDAEHALNATYAKTLGVQLERLLVSRPNTGEQALEICEALLLSGEVPLVVVDSVAALVPEAELEGEAGDTHPGLQARLMSQALRKLIGITQRAGGTLIFINQLRQRLGVAFRSPEVTTGGNALHFFASVRIEVRHIGAIRKGNLQVGNRTRIKIVKNKLSPASKQAEVEVDIIYGRGISQGGDLLEQGLEARVIQRSGAWFSFQHRRFARGRDAAAQTIETNPRLAHDLLEAIVHHLRPNLKP